MSLAGDPEVTNPQVSVDLADLYVEGLMVTVVFWNNTFCSLLMYFLLALGSNLNSHRHLTVSVGKGIISLTFNPYSNIQIKKI